MFVLGNDDSNRFNLIDTGIRAVKRLGIRVETDFTFDLLLKLVFNLRVP
jgi:hypothetical protein